MKRLMIVVTMVVLMGVSGVAEAGPWDNPYPGVRSNSFFGYSGRSGYGGYGYDRTAGRVATAITGAVRLVETVSNVQIQSRGMRVIEKEQEFQHQQAWLRMGDGKVKKPQVVGRFQQEKEKDKQIKNLQLELKKAKAENQKLQEKVDKLQEQMRDLQKKMDELLRLALTRTSAEVTELSPEP